VALYSYHQTSVESYKQPLPTSLINIIAKTKLVVTELLHAASTETNASTHHGLMSLCSCLINWYNGLALNCRQWYVWSMQERGKICSLCKRT